MEEKEKVSAGGERGKRETDDLPVRSYLDQTVVPVLIQALSEVAKER